MARKAWNALSDAYRKRLQRGGISKRQYESGASLKAARGHAATPEHPGDAYGAVGKYKEYIERVSGLHERVIERKARLFSARFKYSQERSEQYVMQGGTDVPAPGIIQLKRMLEMTDNEIEETLADPDIDKDWKFLWYH